jgi:hypothetical protein
MNPETRSYFHAALGNTGKLSAVAFHVNDKSRLLKVKRNVR